MLYLMQNIKGKTLWLHAIRILLWAVLNNILDALVVGVPLKHQGLKVGKEVCCLKGECPEFVDVPLLCARELWQPVSDRDWNKRYQEEISLKQLKGRRGLTMGNLLLLRQSLIQGDNSYQVENPDLSAELAEWVERVDDLSMLLWMSFTLTDQGRPQVL